MAKRGKLIALYSPLPQMGKSTVADYLVEEYGFVRLKFAGPLKDMAAALLSQAGFDHTAVHEMLEGGLKETKLPVLGNKTPREIMQTLGTEWGRDCISESLWVNLAKVKIERELQAGRNVVVDDMRFLNELRTVQAAEGSVAVAVHRKSEVPSCPHNPKKHASESGLNPCDFDRWVLNHGTIEELKAMVDEIIEEEGFKVRKSKIPEVLK